MKQGLTMFYSYRLYECRQRRWLSVRGSGAKTNQSPAFLTQSLCLNPYSLLEYDVICIYTRFTR